MFYIEDIKEFRLDEKVRYLVRDTIRFRLYDCKLIFQADFIFLFEIMDRNVPNNRICISKVDYFLNNNLIKDISETRKERNFA